MRVRKTVYADEMARNFQYCGLSPSGLVWAVQKPGLKVGQPAGTRNCGYWRVRCDRTLYVVHRVIWALHHGDLGPEFEIDHIDRDGYNNSISNLRLVTRLQNMGNRIHNRTEHPGVYQLKGKWRAKCGAGAKGHLGTFDTFEEALAARQKAVENLYGAEYLPD